MSSNLKEVYQQALTYLARREHAQAELQQKLAQKGGSESDINAVLARLIEQKLQSDARFAEMYTRARSQRGHGPIKIRYELRQRGVAPDLIQAAMDEIDWPEIMKQVRIKKFGHLDPSDWTERQRQQRFLEQRGFSHEMIQWAGG